MKRRSEPRVIALGGQKGGVGKTTLAISAAVEWMSRGARVALVDADPQRSVITWSEVAASREIPTPTVVAMGPSLGRREQLPTFAEGYDITIVDLPPRLEAEIRAVLLVADVVVLPCGPSGPDMWALAETLELVAKARQLRPEVDARVLINRVDTRTTMGREARAPLKRTGVPVLECEIGQRVAFMEAITGGMGPASYEPGGAAANEIKALVDELEGLW